MTFFKHALHLLGVDVGIVTIILNTLVLLSQIKVPIRALNPYIPHTLREVVVTQGAGSCL